MNKTIPDKFAPLFVPNWSKGERQKFTPEFKENLRSRLLAGEELAAVEFGVKEIILKGGRISGKTVNDELACIPDFFDSEPGDIWYCRSEENTIRRSIFQSLQSTIRGLGYTISNRTDTDFKISTSPFEIKCNRTGNVCQFFAINKDIDRTKAMTPPSGRLKRVMLEEANEPDNETYVEALKSTALRFMDEMGKIVYRYNPPASFTHWANRFYPQKSRQGAILIHSKWTDIAKLLDPVVIAEILRMKRDDPLHYAFWYGGEVVSMQGRVIWSFDKEKHVIPLSALQRQIVGNLYYQPVYMFYGVDSGLKRDATACSAWALYPDAKLIKIGTFYLDIREELRKTGIRGIAHADQAVLLSEWHEGFKRKMSEYGITIPEPLNERWCFDGAAITQDLMLEFEKLTHYKTKAVTDKDVERDIARLVNSYKSGQLYILDMPDNEISIWEMENFSRDEENEIPEGQSDHTIDADKYATYEYYYDFI